MNNQNSHLDDLFAAVRQKEPVISEEHARELLRTREHMQMPFTLFSMKGIIMTTIGLSLASLTVYFLLGGSPQESQKNIASKILTHEPQARIENLFAQRIEEPRKEKENSLQKVDIPLTTLLPADLKVVGIKPFSLSEDKFSKLGIKQYEGGTISFSQKNEKGKIFTVSFPPYSGVIIPHSQIQKEITDAPLFAPVIVTDTKGNKRLMQFTSEANGIKVKAIEMESRSDKDTDSQIDNFMLNAFKISGLGAEKDSVEHMSINIPGKNAGIRLNIKSDTRTHVNSLPNNKNHRIIKMEKILHFDSLIKAKAINENNIDEVLKDINLDTTFFKGKNFNFNISGDEVEIDNDNPEQITNNDIYIDSIYKAANEIIRKTEVRIKSINMDSMIQDAAKRAEEANEGVKKMNLDSVMRLCNTVNEKTKKMMANYDSELNTLIPILVRPSSSEHFSKAEGITYDDGLIFWYKPEKEFTDIIPEAAQASNPASQNKVSVITEMAVYPNPAHSKAIIRFSLSEPRTIAFSIHDLLGKRVIETGSIHETGVGDFKKELDLSDLPAGVYLLVMTTDKGDQHVERLAVEK